MIPPKDYDFLKKAGIGAIFDPGTNIAAAAEIPSLIRRRMAAWPGAMGRLPFDHNALTELCHRRGIRRLSLFGSVLKGIDRPDGEVDLLVEFAPNAVPGLLGMAEIEAELSEHLGGRRVDLRIPR